MNDLKKMYTHDKLDIAKKNSLWSHMAFKEI